LSSLLRYNVQIEYLYTRVHIFNLNDAAVQTTSSGEKLLNKTFDVWFWQIYTSVIYTENLDVPASLSASAWCYSHTTDKPFQL